MIVAQANRYFESLVDQVREVSKCCVKMAASLTCEQKFHLKNILQAMNVLD